ncbi:MAG: TetR/AcrR family transcriptional regulator [Pseudomonadota bacterium]
MASVQPIVSRARSDAQKAERRRSILEAADTHFQQVGFEAFSMAKVGRLAGVAKGTLYLYFSTREAVLLALFGEKLTSWVNGVCTHLDASEGERISDEVFVRAVFLEAHRDPALIRLMARLDSVIEHNVSLEALIAAKRHMAAELARLGAKAAPALSLTPAQVQETLAAFGALLLGVGQLDHGPELDDAVLPEDVRQFRTFYSPESLFLTNAGRILTGIRQGPG